MFGNLFEGPHLIFIGILLIVVFGAKKLPELGKGLGEGLRGFKEGVKGIGDEPKNDAHLVTPVAPEKPLNDTVTK